MRLHRPICLSEGRRCGQELGVMVFRTLSCSLLLTFPVSNGYKVDVSSFGLIDHLKYGPLLHCNALIQPSGNFLFFFIYFLDMQFTQTPADLSTRVLEVRQL